MKIEHLQKIIERIQNQIHCPKCKARFIREDIEINSVKGNHVGFSSACRVCRAKAQISAEIGVNGATKNPSIRKTLPSSSVKESQKILNPQDLESIKRSVGGFSEQDVSRLFE